MGNRLEEEQYSRREFLRRSAHAGIRVGVAFVLAETASLSMPSPISSIQKRKETVLTTGQLNPNPYPSPNDMDTAPDNIPLRPSLIAPQTPVPKETPVPKQTSAPEVIKVDAGEIVWRGDAEKPFVYLTVDDCYDPNMVTRAMDAADKYGVKLTFFPIGTNVERFPEVFREAYLRGHAIENHTYTHEWLDNKTASNIEYQILKQHEAVQNAIGKEYKQNFLRPPGGAGVFRTEHPWPLLWATAQRLGYRIAMWTADSNGWRMYPRTDMAAINYIMENVNRYFFRGSIVLQHAIPDDMEALPIIMAEAKKNHWQMITMPQGIR